MCTAEADDEADGEPLSLSPPGGAAEAAAPAQAAAGGSAAAAPLQAAATVGGSAAATPSQAAATAGGSAAAVPTDELFPDSQPGEPPMKVPGLVPSDELVASDCSEWGTVRGSSRDVSSGSMTEGDDEKEGEPARKRLRKRPAATRPPAAAP